MSTIGPIHFWLYKKIQFQEFVVQTLYKIEDISTEVNVNEGALPLGKMEDLIDTENIHAWLQEHINIVEKRLAYTTSTLINKGYTINQILECIVDNIKIDSEKAETAIEAYTLLDKYLLNGRPCDDINKVTIETDNKLSYIETKQIHNEFWILNNSDSSNYYLIRKTISDIILSNTKFILAINEKNEFEIKLKKGK
jgi:hypothetical protein